MPAPQDEANEHKHDSIPQAAQRMWTSPQRLRKKELCSILNFAVRCDGVEIVQPLAMLVRPKVSLWCARFKLEMNYDAMPDTRDQSALCYGWKARGQNEKCP